MAVAALSGAAGSVLEVSLPSQVLILGALAIVIGVPHGALDWPVARRWLRPLCGWAWAPVFATLYLAVAVPVVIGWIAIPGIMLGFLLLTGIYHFGVSDTARSGLSTRRRLLEGLARGLAPVAVTAWAWKAEVETLFGHLAETPAPATLASAAAVAGPAALLLLAIAAAWRLAEVRSAESAGRRRAWAKSLELAVLPLPFLCLPPLLAFAVYWNGLHSLHVLLAAASHQQGGGAKAVWSAYRSALPATAATLALAALAYAVFFSGETVTAAGMAIVFMGLSALNTPHMLFISVTARYR